MNEQQRQGIRQILEHELRPAMGCTEPIAVAYTAALARTLLGRMPEHMQVDCSGNIVKNVKGVTVPNSGGRKGIDTAAVMGVISGRSDLELEVLNVVTPQDMEEVERLKAQGFCECRLIEGVPNLYVQVTVTGGGESAVVAIQDAHTNIVKKVKNGQVLFEKEQLQAGDLYTMEKEYLNIHDILEFGETEPVEDLRSLLEEQCRDNWNVAMEGLSKPYGAGVGYTLMANRKKGDLRTYCKAAAAAGSDARMNGCALPVVINSGSGNQGITVSVPVMVYARETGCGEEKMYRALAISNLLAIHQKKYIGKLSAYCGAVSAASAAGAAIAWLRGGDEETVANVLVNALVNDGGILCDGAKASCAAKIASGLEAAFLAVDLAEKGYRFPDGEGLCAASAEDTLRRVGYVARVGMASTDVEILKIMTGQTQVDEDQGVSC